MQMSFNLTRSNMKATTSNFYTGFSFKLLYYQLVNHRRYMHIFCCHGNSPPMARCTATPSISKLLYVSTQSMLWFQNTKSEGYKNRKLVPFYFVSIDICFIFALPCALLPILKYIFLSNKPSGITVAFMVIWIAFGLTATTANIIAINCSSRLVTYMRSLVSYHKRLHLSIFPLQRYRYQINNSSNGLLCYFREINFELLKFLNQAKNIDYLGIYIYNQILYGTFFACVAPPNLSLFWIRPFFIFI